MIKVLMIIMANTNKMVLLDLCCVYYVVNQGEQLFPSWSDMFSRSGASFNSRLGIYSFDGRNVITDPSWYVGL